MSENTSGVRIMYPTQEHPGGYAVYMTAKGQTLNLLSGRRTTSYGDAWAHIDINLLLGLIGGSGDE